MASSHLFADSYSSSSDDEDPTASTERSTQHSRKPMKPPSTSAFSEKEIEGGATIDATDFALIIGGDHEISESNVCSSNRATEGGEGGEGTTVTSSLATAPPKVEIDRSLFESNSDEEDSGENSDHSVECIEKPAGNESALAGRNQNAKNAVGEAITSASIKRKRLEDAPMLRSVPKVDEGASKMPLTATEALAMARQRQSGNGPEAKGSAEAKSSPRVPRKGALSKSAAEILAKARAKRSQQRPASGQTDQPIVSTDSNSKSLASAVMSAPRKRSLPGKRGASPLPPSLSAALNRGPAFYPRIELEQFWRTIRNWDFVTDLNDYMRGSRGGGSSSSGSAEGVAEKSIARTAQPLPDRFDSAEQYKALWAPLLLGESKSQILSDVSTSLAGGSKLGTTRVKVQPVAGSDGQDHSECITVQVREVSGSVRGGAAGPFVVNDTLLLVRDDSIISSALRGTLQKDTAEKKMSSSLIGTSHSRWGLLGTAMNRSRKVDGLIVKVSRKHWDSCSVPEMYLVHGIGYNVTALREFTALCNIGRSIPLTAYLLGKDLARNNGNNAASSLQHNSDPLSEGGGENALGIGFRIYAKSKFNRSQLEAISVAAREYGDGGFTLVKGPPGTGKTTTLVALLNALHLRQYQRYYAEIERITTESKSCSVAEDLAACNAAAKVKPRILVAAPSNAAVDNVILKLIEVRFVDGNGGPYSPSIVRVGKGQSPHVRHVSLDAKIDAILAEGTKPEKLEATIGASRKELRRMQAEIRKLQRRIRALFAASPYPLSSDWEIRVDEANFDATGQVLFVNHRAKSVTYDRPPPPYPDETSHPTTSMPHYKDCMNALVKYIERHNALTSKLEQYILVQNTAAQISTGNYTQAASQLNQELETQILNSEHIVLTTLGSAGSKAIESASKFEVVVVDEAAQSSEPSTLVALQLGSSHAILVGDPQQLPATIFSESGRITKYDRSLFQRLEEAGHPVHMLNTQYRMHPAISDFPRRIFYDDMLLDGHNVKKSNYGGQLTDAVRANFPSFQHFTIFDVDSSEERDGTSLSNSSEAHLALHLFSSLDRETDGVASRSRVAIIAPYSQQVALLRRIFAEKLGESYVKQVDISTVDTFQGKEAEIVILSCVRAAGSRGIGFLSDVQRMNVALTRAQHFLFVIARCRTIVVNPYWRDLVRHAREKHAIIKVPVIKSRKKRKRKGGGNAVGPPFPDLRVLVPFHSATENQVTVLEKPGDAYESEGEFSA